MLLSKNCLDSIVAAGEKNWSEGMAVARKQFSEDTVDTLKHECFESMATAKKQQEKCSEGTIIVGRAENGHCTTRRYSNRWPKNSLGKYQH